MEKWAKKELQQADLGDVRRNKRLIRIVEDLAAQPTASIPQACGNVAATSAVATYSIVAWRLLWLTYEARFNPDIPCDSVLEADEWQSLSATIHKDPIPPQKPPSLREAVRMIAKLGGFLGRKGDGEPGVKTIWRGLRRLHDISETWKLAHQIT